MRYRHVATVAAVLLVLLGYDAAQAEPVVDGLPSSADGGTPLAQYSFDAALTDADGSPRAVPDSTGRGHDLQMKTARGGSITVLRDGRVRVRFPEPCEDSDRPGCPHAILESTAAADLNPEGQRIRYGVTLRMTAEETSDGSNVLQKGYSTEGSQYKLQVDGAAGRPTCVLVGVGDPTIRVAQSKVAVADGAWHRVECLRAGDTLTILVDGTVTGRRTIPGDLTVHTSEPLRIGGKGTSPNNDQYFGELADAFVTIG